MRLTMRDRKLLAKLAAARWLSTRQVRALLFSNVTLGMARRRLRLLGEARYVFSWQHNSMAEALHTLDAKGKEFLKERGWGFPVKLERAPPKNLEHFMGINDIRVAVERSAESDGITIGFFYACWELQQRGWAYGVIPDAACHVERGASSLTLLVEYDRGQESPEYVSRTKFARYAQGLDGFPFAMVVIVSDSEERLEQLRERARRIQDAEKFVFVLREAVLEPSWSVSQWL